MTIYIKFLAHSRYSRNLSSFTLGEAPDTELRQVPVTETQFPHEFLAFNEIKPLGLLPCMMGIQTQHRADWEKS